MVKGLGEIYYKLSYRSRYQSIGLNSVRNLGIIRFFHFLNHLDLVGQVRAVNDEPIFIKGVVTILEVGEGLFEPVLHEQVGHGVELRQFPNPSELRLQFRGIAVDVDEVFHRLEGDLLLSISLLFLLDLQGGIVFPQFQHDLVFRSANLGSLFRKALGDRQGVVHHIVVVTILHNNCLSGF